VKTQVWWYLARSTGIVAWVLATASVVWGMALATRALGAKPKAPWLLDLHRYLGGLTVLFTAGHVFALIADSYVEFDLIDVLVPGASDWKPLPVALGVVALWFLVGIELSSLLMKRLPRRLWHAVHLTSFAVYVLATIHFLTAGTDSTNLAVRVAAAGSVGVVAFFALYRWIGPGKAASVRSAQSARPARPAQPAPPRVT
jgi:predicted ferric reductase